MYKLFLFLVIFTAVLLSACSSDESCTCTTKYYTSADSLTGSMQYYDTASGKCSSLNKSTTTSSGLKAVTTCK